MQKRKNSIDSRIDYGLILPVFILLVIGIMALYVALYHDINELDLTTMMIRQVAWIGTGIVLVVIFIHMSSKFLWKMTPVGYVIGLGLMVLPLFFYDAQTAVATGSRNWVAFNGTNLFQPSEFMKIPFILLMARVITQHNAYYTNRHMRTDFWLLLKMGLVVVPVMGLLAAQSDFGTGLVYLAIFFGMMLLSGVSWKILGPMFALIAAFGGFLIYLVFTDVGREILLRLGFAQFQLARIDAWIHPFADTSGSSFQQSRALLAIATGGLFGQGFNVSQIYIPVRESDMIFTVIGENFGFVGSTIVVFLYFLLIYRMIKVTFESNNQLYTYISTGVIMMILFHVFTNIGANIGLLPLTGIPLPFISQGGSAMISNLVGVGLVLSMRYHMKPDFELWKEGRNNPLEKQQTRATKQVTSRAARHKAVQNKV